MGKARARKPSQRKTEMKDKNFEPGRAARPGNDGPVIEAFGEYPAFARRSAAPEPARDDTQSDRAASE